MAYFFRMRNYKVNYTLFCRLLFIFLMAVLTFLLCTPLRALPPGEHFNALYISAPIGFILYYILTYKLCKKYAPLISTKFILFCIIGGFLSLQLPVRIISFTETAITLPEQEIHLSGVILGYFTYKRYIKTWLAWTMGLFFIIFIFTNQYIYSLIHL